MSTISRDGMRIAFLRRHAQLEVSYAHHAIGITAATRLYAFTYELTNYLPLRKIANLEMKEEA